MARTIKNARPDFGRRKRHEMWKTWEGRGERRYPSHVEKANHHVAAAVSTAEKLQSCMCARALHDLIYVTEAIRFTRLYPSSV